MPVFIKERYELIHNYEKTDLEFRYVVMKLLELSAIKMVDISDTTIKLWYCEFISNEWTKSIFDRQLQTAKYSIVFGHIDLAMWFDETMLYTQGDFNKRLRIAVQHLIDEGKQLSEKNIELSESEKEKAELYAMVRVKENYALKRAELFEQYQFEKVQKIKSEISELAKEITNSNKAREIIIELHKRGLLMAKNETEVSIIAKHPKYFIADIDPEYLKTIINEIKG